MIMDKNHPKWKEFLKELEGPNGCDLSKEILDTNCSADRSKPIAKRLLKNYKNIDIKATFDFFESHGGCCDCTILFNVA